MTNLDIFKQANSYLDGKRTTATIVALLIMLITGLPQNINTKFTVVTLLLSGPIGVGTAIFFLNLIRGYDVSIAQLFDGFRQFIPSFILTILTFIIVMLGFVCLIVPGIILAVGLSFSTYVMADNPDLSAIEAMRKSWDMVDGYKMKFFLFCLLGAVLCFAGVLCFIIGIFFVLPILYTAIALFYEKLRTGTMNNIDSNL